MNRKEYTDAVLTALRHVTDRERLAIRAELDAHIEDHMAALRELDYPPELAEERALAAMGDPAEVGRELNACYQSWFWVILGRAAAVVTVLMCILALLHVGLLGMVADSISARIYPDEDSCFAKPTATEPGWTSGYRWGTTCCMSIGSVWDRMIRWENRWRK